MTGDCTPCLSQAVRHFLVPHGVTRVALLGAGPESAEKDIHLLVEFSRAAPAVALADWLRMQRDLGMHCGCPVELVSVTRLEERVAAESVALTILYDAASDG